MQANKALALTDKYTGLVQMQAWKAWKALPHSVQRWIQVEDLINHGKFLTYVYIKDHYDPKRSDKISTGLWHFLHSVFIRDYIELYGAWKRGWRKTEDGDLVSLNIDSLEGMMERMKARGFKNVTMDDVLSCAMPERYTSERSIVENANTKCFVIPALARVFERSSLTLKSETINWLCNGEHVHTKSKPFKRLSKEFRLLCKAQNLCCDDLCHLVNSRECLDSFTRKVLGVPYDINDPTPEVLNRYDLYVPAQRSFKGNPRDKENQWLIN